MKSIFNGRQFSVQTKAGRLTAATEAELTAKFEAVRTRASAILGRRATDDEVERGVPKAPATRSEAFAANIMRTLAAKATEVRPTREETRLRMTESRLNDERRSKLTAVEREHEDASLAASAAVAKRADDQRRAEIMATPAYQSVERQARDLVFHAAFDESVSAGQLAALEDQLTALKQTQDVAVVRSNLRTIQEALTSQIEVEATQLRQASDAIAARKAALGSGLVFDQIGTELVGDLAFVCLTVGDRTIKVSQARYDSRESDESLRAALFPTTAGGATNV